MVLVCLARALMEVDEVYDDFDAFLYVRNGMACKCST